MPRSRSRSWGLSRARRGHGVVDAAACVAGGPGQSAYSSPICGTRTALPVASKASMMSDPLGRRRMVPRLRRAVAVLAALGALATSAAAAPDRPEVLRQKFSARINEILFETGTERVKVGLWCRDAGLVAQATASFLRAVEESQGKNWWAVNVIGVVRKA